MSRQKVNNQKTSVYFLKNVDRRVQNQICDVSRFAKKDDLGTYLGAFLSKDRVRNKNFQHINIIDTMQSKLSS